MTAGLGYFGDLAEGADLALLPLASARRTMLADPAYLDIHRLLAPLPLRRLYPKTWEQAREDFQGQVELVGRLVAASAAARRSLADIDGWLERPPRPDLLALFQHVAGERAQADQVLVVTLLARVLWTQRISSVPTDVHLAEVAADLSRPELLLERMAAELGALHRDFPGYLVVEAAMRVRHDPRMATVLATAHQQLARVQAAGDGGRARLHRALAAGSMVLNRHLSIHLDVAVTAGRP